MEAGFTITKQGWHLLAKLLAGDKLELSKIMVGSGKVPEGVNPGEITELVRPVALATSTVPQVADKQVSFIVEYRNDLNGGLAEGFWLNEFGVYANDPDEGEVLLYYATMGDYPQYVAAYNGQAVDVRRYPVVIALSECYNVELKPPAGAWVTFEELAETLKRRGYHSNLNLLINGDFRKPVNRNGKREYTGAGFTLDGWKNSLTNMVTLNDEFITISRLQTDNGYENFQQTRPGKLYNKETVTVSIMYRNVKSSEIALYNISQNQWLNSVILSTSNDWNVLSFTTTIGENVFSITDLLGIMIYPGMAGQQVTNSLDIKAVKLELGSVQTLAHKDADGNWVLNDPPNYDLQYALCSQYSPITGEFVGSQHSNPNLLDNWYFADPINQRGQTEYVGNTIYSIDRWITYGLKVSINNNNLTLIPQENAGIAFGQLTKEFLFNKQLTLSVLLLDGRLLTGTGSLKSGSNWLQSDLYRDNDIRLWLQNRNNNFQTVIDCTTSIQIVAIKLEFGPVQTLAHKDADGNWILNDPPPNKALELAKCQRYQIELKKTNSDSNIGFGIANTTRNVTAFIPLPVSLRNKPIIANQKMVMCMGIFSTGYILQAPVNVSVYSYTSSGIHVNCELVSNDYNFIQGNSYQVYLQLQQSQFLIDANL